MSDGLAAGTIVLWYGVLNDIPTSWSLCDGTGNTPDLRGRFVIGAGGIYDPGDEGGSQTLTLTIDNLPSHSHRQGNFRAISDDWKGSGSSSPGNSTGDGSWQQDTGSTGEGVAVDIRPPYHALCYIMKIGIV